VRGDTVEILERGLVTITTLISRFPLKKYNILYQTMK